MATLVAVFNIFCLATVAAAAAENFPTAEDYATALADITKGKETRKVLQKYCSLLHNLYFMYLVNCMKYTLLPNTSI